MEPVAPGATVSATFKITSGPATFNGDLIANLAWSTNGLKQSGKALEKVRNVPAIKINEFAISSTTPADATNSFIELYNAGAGDVDLSNWSLTEHATQQSIFSAVKIPAGTKLAPHGFYLLGLSNSGLAAAAKKGDAAIHVRSVAGMAVGDSIEIDTGSGVETRKIASLGAAAGGGTSVWQPVPDGPVITIPVGSTSVPVSSVAGFEVGQQIGLGYGTSAPAVARTVEQYEVVTITAVGKAGTQTRLAADAKVGDTGIRVMTGANNISVGDKIRLDIDSHDHGVETVTVTNVTLQGGRGAGSLDLAAPLKFNHANNMPLSVKGTGITFQPATAFAHSSNEPVQTLGTGITLDSPLASDHAINAVVRDATVTTEGYQGTVAPNQWFGGPALANAGSMVLRDGAGLVVDSLNYGGIVDPWASQGFQTTAGSNRGGCSVPAPAGGGRGNRGRGAAAAPPATVPNRSAARTTDGTDTNSNCLDFQLQTPTPGAPNHV